MEDEGGDLAFGIGLELECGIDDVVFEAAWLGFKHGKVGLAGELGVEGLVFDSEGEEGAGRELVGAGVGLELFGGAEKECRRGFGRFGSALFAIVLEEGDVGDLAGGALKLKFCGDDFEEEAVVASMEEAEERLAGEAGPEVVAALDDGEAVGGVEFKDASEFAGGFGRHGEFGAGFGGSGWADGSEQEGWSQGAVVDEDDADGFGVRLNLDGTAVAAGAAIVLPGGCIEEAGDEDAEADLGGGTGELGARSEQEADGVGERGGVGVQKGLTEANEVSRSGAQSTCTGEGLEVPIGAGFGSSKGRCQAVLGGGVEGDSGVGHAKGFGDEVNDEIFPGVLVKRGQEVAQQTYA